MRKRNSVFAAVLIVATAISAIAQTADSHRYQKPPQQVIDAFDAPPLPQAILSPSKTTLALLYRRSYPG